MIKFNFKINDINEYQTGKLPKKAIKLKENQTVDEFLSEAMPIAVILCVLLISVIIGKTIICNVKVVEPVFVLVGCAIGFLLLIVHECLHGIVYPKEAIVTIGKLKGKLKFVSLASYPLKRNKFILMCLFSFVLGLVPLVIFILSPASFTISNAIFWGMACIGMFSPFIDLYNVIIVLKNTQKNDMIMFYKDDIYCVPQFNHE